VRIASRSVAAFEQLAVQGQARQVRADHGNRQRRRGGRRGLRQRCGPGIHPAAAEAGQRRVVCARGDEGHAEGQFGRGRTGGQRQRAPAEQVDEVGIEPKAGVGP